MDRANAEVRAQQRGLYLPSCRGYELVTPADKAGGIIKVDPYAEAGENILSASSPLTETP